MEGAKQRRNADNNGQGVSNPERQSLALGDRPQGSGGTRPDATGGDWWTAEPDVGRTLDGLAAWLDFPESH